MSSTKVEYNEKEIRAKIKTRIIGQSRDRTSVGIVIPKPIVIAMNLHPKDLVELVYYRDKEEIVIRKVVKNERDKKSSEN